MKMPNSSEGRYTMILFQIDHENCWSQSFRETNSSAHTLVIRPYKEKKYILGAIELRTDVLKNFRRLLGQFKKSPSIIDTVSVDIIDKRRKIFRIMFRERYKRMVSSTLYEHMSIYQNDAITSKGERIISIIPNDEVKETRDELESIGKLIKFSTRSVNVEDFVSANLDLTPREKTSLYSACKSGYYKVPRTVHLEEISMSMNLSKSSFAETLRVAESKVVRKWNISNYPFMEENFWDN